MNNFVDALREKISLTQDELEEYWDAESRTEARLELLKELLAEELGEDSSPAEAKEAPSPKKKRGRPKKAAASKAAGGIKSSQYQDANKSLYEEAIASLPGGGSGTTSEEAARARQRFNPVPRTPEGHGGVRVGGKVEEVLEGASKKKKAGHSHISEED